jgi:hypothetical protein
MPRLVATHIDNATFQFTHKELKKSAKAQTLQMMNMID